MIKIFKCGAILAAMYACLQLAGCATPYQRQALTLNNRTQIASTHVLVNGVQKRIMIHQNAYGNQYKSSAYEPMPEGAIVTPQASEVASGGSIADMIAHAIVQHVADRHDRNLVNKELPIILIAQGHDAFMLHFKQDLMQQLKKLHWLNVSSGSLGYRLKADNTALAAHFPDNNLLLVGTTYALNSNLNQLEVVANIESDAKQGGKAVPIYKNTFTYIYTLNHSNNRDLNQTAWANYGAKLLKTQLKKASLTLSHIIAVDIANPLPTLATNAPATVTIRPIHGDHEGSKIQAAVLHHAHNRYTLLLPNGEIYNVNQRYLVQPSS